MTAFVSGLGFGPRGVTVAYSSAMCLITVPICSWGLWNTGIRLQEAITRLASPLVSGSLAALLTLTFMGYAGQMMYGVVALFVGASMFCALYVFALLVVFRKWAFFLGVVKAGGPPDAPSTVRPLAERSIADDASKLGLKPSGT